MKFKYMKILFPKRRRSSNSIENSPQTTNYHARNNGNGDNSDDRRESAKSKYNDDDRAMMIRSNMQHLLSPEVQMESFKSTGYIWVPLPEADDISDSYHGFSLYDVDEFDQPQRLSTMGMEERQRKTFKVLADNSVQNIIQKVENVEDLTDEDWAKLERQCTWLVSILRSDPRWQIMNFFHIIAQKGTDEEIDDHHIELYKKVPMMNKNSTRKVFTVWRPTSLDSIRMMMSGDAVGKGLNVKGKSAKRGLLSGYVPFLQIHSNEKHKHQISTLPKGARINVFFRSKDVQMKAISMLEQVLEEMVTEAQKARDLVAADKFENDDEFEATLLIMQKWEMENPTINILDDYAPSCYGVDIPERLFWEACVIRKDINREPGSSMDTGRPSTPDFQDMNFATTRYQKPSMPKSSVMQFGGYNDDPLCPLTFVVAYEENQKVTPVASDFDCFLVGTKGVAYDEPLPAEQLKMVKWCIEQIESVLDDPESEKNSWTSNWLNVLKREALKGVHCKMPPYGFGDPTSYNIMKNAVNCLKGTGSVRHGAECFNFYFPQELDEYFLVFSSEGLSSDKVRWQYMSLPELQTFLTEMATKDYVIPLNPKWVLCDQGWKSVYDQLHASEHPNVKQALNAWYPPDSGIKEKIEEVHKRYPKGFNRSNMQSMASLANEDGTAAMDKANLDLKRYIRLQRAKQKLKAIMTLNNVKNSKEMNI